ncbi:MAG: efflux RND transporter periplasmic adaptor subunit [Verrucomicrobiota bacterium]
MNSKIPSANGGEAAPVHNSSVTKWVVILMVGALIAAAAYWWSTHNAPAEKKPSGFARGEMPPVPVVAGVVAEKDVPIYLEGLGTVQAFNTVTVRARVDGQIVKVAFTEGQEVHAGDVLVQIDPDPYRTVLDQAVAKKGQDEALLGNAKADLKRYGDLLANEGVTQQVFDTQKAQVNQLEAAVKADQATIESAKVQLAYTTIVSPIDGRIGMRLVDQGNMVRASDATGLVVITQLKPISVVFTLPEQTLGKIQKQASLAADLTVFAIGRDNVNVLGEGKLTVIDNQIDTTTGTIKLKATFPNTDLRLWPGQFVNARLLVNVRKGSAVVPASVVQRGPEGAFAFVIKEDQTVEIRPIKVAQIEQGEALIEDGLHSGERVVVDGQYKLQKGSKVKTADASGSGQGGERGGRRPKSAGASDDGGTRGTKKAKP